MTRDIGSDWMTAPEAIAWIMFRDEAFAAECREENCSRLRALLAVRQVERDEKPTRTRERACELLADRCRNQRIIARGRSLSERQEPALKLSQIAADAWHGASLSRGNLALPRGNPFSGEFVVRDTRSRLAIWSDVIFKKKDILRLYPAEPSARLLGKKSDRPNRIPEAQLSSGSTPKALKQERRKPARENTMRVLASLEQEMTDAGESFAQASYKDLHRRALNRLGGSNAPILKIESFRTAVSDFRSRSSNLD